MGSETQRFQFIGHALRGDGPFRPSVGYDVNGRANTAGSSYLVQYPRESDAKFARRNELAFFASPLAQASSRFTGYLSTRSPVRDIPHDLYTAVAEDADGKGSAIDQFWQQFMFNAKARGSMLLLVDMPQSLPSSQADQMRLRAAPVWTGIAPELLTDWSIGDDGRFVFAEFSGQFEMPDGSRVPCTWYFDRAEWSAEDDKHQPLAAGTHPLGVCPLLIFTEGGDFPHFGPFASIADLAKRLFNLDSELDEILRSQTFSLLTMQVPDGSTDAQKLAAAQAAGQTIGTQNLVVHSGSTPAFIAPPDGPARIYLDRIDKLREQIDEIGLKVSGSQAQESGISLQMRFQALNAELSRFSARMEDLERNAWDLSRKWLGMTSAPVVQWPRDFSLSDVEKELQILADMRDTGMPPMAIAAQQKRIISQQFVGLEQADQAAISAEIDQESQALEAGENVIQLRPDPNAEARAAIVKALNG
jgi:hypothetical protein